MSLDTFDLVALAWLVVLVAAVGYSAYRAVLDERAYNRFIREHNFRKSPPNSTMWLARVIENASALQLVGEWETSAEASFGPDQPVIKCEGTETVRSIGGFWTVSESHGTPMGMPMTGIMTLGYDPAKKKYVGTWIDSMTSHLWVYEGTLDADGKILTLEAEGPSFTEPGKRSMFRDVIELKNKDHKILTSSVQGDDGQWTTFMTSHAKRKK